jgi:hypothetical protein
MAGTAELRLLDSHEAHDRTAGQAPTWRARMPAAARNATNDELCAGTRAGHIVGRVRPDPPAMPTLARLRQARLQQAAVRRWLRLLGPFGFIVLVTVSAFQPCRSQLRKGASAGCVQRLARSSKPGDVTARPESGYTDQTSHPSL